MDNTKGIGLEMEGFIVNSQRAQEKIENQPSCQWTINIMQRLFPALALHLSTEQASVMLELKTGRHQTEDKAIQELMEIRQLVNNCLAGQGCKLIFEPVARQSFEFIPADISEDSRSRQLVETWSKTEKGTQMLFGTATASFQINDSRIKGPATNESILAFAARVHNLFTRHRELLIAQNSGITDWQGKSRLDLAIDLLSTVKARQFKKRGLEPIIAPLPRHFTTEQDFIRWSCAHSDVDSIDQVDPKNEHAVTVKVKRKGVLIIETRIFDSLEDLPAIKHLINLNRQLLQQL